jgi:hypothetical protein
MKKIGLKILCFFVFSDIICSDYFSNFGKNVVKKRISFTPTEKKIKKIEEDNNYSTKKENVKLFLDDYFEKNNITNRSVKEIFFSYYYSFNPKKQIENDFFREAIKKSFSNNELPFKEKSDFFVRCVHEINKIKKDQKNIKIDKSNLFNPEET